MKLEKIKDALRKDFADLYKREYSTNYQAERLIRNTEIGIMDFNNLVKLLSKDIDIEIELDKE